MAFYSQFSLKGTYLNFPRPQYSYDITACARLRIKSHRHSILPNRNHGAGIDENGFPMAVVMWRTIFTGGAYVQFTLHMKYSYQLTQKSMLSLKNVQHPHQPLVTKLWHWNTAAHWVWWQTWRRASDKISRFVDQCSHGVCYDSQDTNANNHCILQVEEMEEQYTTSFKKSTWLVTGGNKLEYIFKKLNHCRIIYVL